ncbi:MAG: hypothetical protein A4E35_01943 [Methanoregula sp. PtaU1.Bin051]|nr:MAG: hypothetical protein A4E35_01943 [Methanoregula sp. PtaU1.Bin051]
MACMNPHFFTDSHDLFEQDPIAWAMKNLSGDLSSFTFVPMMTANRRPHRRDGAGMASVKLRERFNGLPGDGAAKR